jgi:hypothetical protein
MYPPPRNQYDRTPQALEMDQKRRLPNQSELQEEAGSRHPEEEGP